MDTLKWVLLESRLALGGLLFVINFFLLVHWRRGGRPMPLLIALGVSVVLLVVQGLVETHREAAGDVMQRIERDVEKGDVATLASVLAPQFSTQALREPLDRTTFLDWARGQLGAIRVNWLIRSPIEITADRGAQFTIAVTYTADVSIRDYSGPVKTRWAISFERISDQWMITRIDLLEFNNKPVSEWRNLRP